jgi:hyperosmotically inducible protein
MQLCKFAALELTKHPQFPGRIYIEGASDLQKEGSFVLRAHRFWNLVDAQIQEEEIMSMLLARSALVVLAVCVSACADQRTDTSSTEETDTRGRTASPNDRTDDLPAADNTGRNVDEGTPGIPNVMEQGQSGPDLEITQTIRQAIVADESLSMNAKNVKVITRNGEVALRGPVESAAEKATIHRIAEQTAGVTRVVDMLEVKMDDMDGGD